MVSEFREVLKIEKLERILISIGFKGIADYLMKIFFPVIIVSLIIGILLLFFPLIPIGFSVIIILLGLGLAFSYPFLKLQYIESNINRHLHFFITYAGTIATMKISRDILFKRIASKKVYGEISEVFEKTLYLAKSWNLGFSSACRKMSKRTPSKVLADFFDRLAIILDFGEEIDEFLYSEQGTILSDYSTEYQKALENIKLIQEVYIALSVSFAFVIAIILLAPLMVDFSMVVMISYAALFIYIVNVFILFAIKAMIPGDSLFSSFKEKNEAQKSLSRWFIISAILSIFLYILFSLFNIHFLTVFGISILPMIIPALLALIEENKIIKKDVQFPVFSRVLGSAIEVRRGGVISALDSIKIHDFGVLQPSIDALYKRLRIGEDKFRAWYLFAIESGSNLVSQFSKIFAESVYLGGKADKIGQIISKNMSKLISLRKLRWQLASGTRGVVYCSFLGVCVTMFITLMISQSLLGILSPELIGAEQEFAEIIESFLPASDRPDFSLILIIISLIVIMMAFTSALMVKLIDGGSYYTVFIDFIILIWVSIIISWLSPLLIRTVIPADFMVIEFFVSLFT